MDALHFDALTRRLTLGLSRRRSLGLLASLSLPGLVAPAAAKKKRKNKKKKACPPCKKRKKGKCKPKADGTACPDGVCQDGACQTGPCPGEQLCEDECIPSDQCCTREDCPPDAGFLCCNGECTDEKSEQGIICLSNIQCCSNYCQPGTILGATAATCAATCRGKTCTQNSKCCRGFSCESGHCGGCGDSAHDCASNADCCFSDCIAHPTIPLNHCLSYPGGPCAKSWDCWSCVYGFKCTMNGGEMCQGGVCACPEDFACCSNSQCPLGETCVFGIDQGIVHGECKPILPG